MSATEAKDRLGVCPRTLFTYSTQHPLCRKIGKERAYSAVAVEMLRDGDHEALSLYGQGERLHPKVRRYYDRLEIQLPAFVLAGK